MSLFIDSGGNYEVVCLHGQNFGVSPSADAGCEQVVVCVLLFRCIYLMGTDGLRVTMLPLPCSFHKVLIAHVVHSPHNYMIDVQEFSEAVHCSQMGTSRQLKSFWLQLRLPFQEGHYFQS